MAAVRPPLRLPFAAGVALPAVRTGPFAFGRGAGATVGGDLSFRAFIRRVDPTYRFYPHAERLMAVLQRVADGELDRLMVFLPPRHSKSQTISRLFTAYYLYRYPARWVGLSSYAADLAYTLSRNARENYRAAGGTFNASAEAVKHWETDQGGGLWAAGVGGQATGKGFHCFPGSVKVATWNGPRRIDDLCRSAYPPEVLSFNHVTQQLEWRRIVATADQPGRPLVEITLSGGGRIRCTADHPIFSVERGYRQAGALVPGETVIQVPQIHALRDVWSADGPNPPLQRVPKEGARHPLPDTLRVLWQGVHPSALPGCKGARHGLHRPLLLHQVQPEPSCSQEPQEVQDVWTADCNQTESVLRRLPSRRTHDCAAAKGTGVPVLWGTVQTQIVAPDALFKRLREPCPLAANAWHGKQPLQDGDQLCRLVPQDASCHFRERWSPLCGVWQASKLTDSKARHKNADSIDPCCSPYRSRSDEQCAGESDYLVLGLPFDVSPEYRCWETDTVSTVTRLGEVADRVYDIQVEGNCNFFADGVLVHNCGIIDDPLKNAEEAASTAIRDKQKDWYRSTFLTRAEPGAAIIIVQTRWHEDDLSGWLLAEEEQEDGDPERWHIVCLAALKSVTPPKFPPTCTVEPDDRAPGAALCPERYDAAKLEKRRKRLGSYFWEALYQQNPTPQEGGILKRHWWRFWQPVGAQLPPVRVRRADGAWADCPVVDLPAHFDEVIQSWDMAFKDAKTSDFVAGQVWARGGADKFLLDYYLAHADLPASLQAVLDFTAKHPAARAKLVEDKANGPAVMQTLRGKVAGLIPVQPQGGKVARVYAVQPDIEAGNVYLPHPRLAAWVQSLINNCAAFPNAAHDDDVDAMSQALTRLGSRAARRESASYQG